MRGSPNLCGRCRRAFAVRFSTVDRYRGATRGHSIILPGIETGSAEGVAPWSGSWLSPPKPPNPPAGKNPGARRAAPPRPIVRPLGRSPAPPEKRARGQLAPSPLRPDRLQLRPIRSGFRASALQPFPRIPRLGHKTAPVGSPSGEKNPRRSLRLIRLLGRSAASARKPAPPQLRSVARATGTVSAPIRSSQPRSGARPAAPPTGLVGGVGFVFLVPAARPRGHSPGLWGCFRLRGSARQKLFTP